MRNLWGEPLLRAGWLNAVMLHWRVPAEVLQPTVPFTLDTHDGEAFVSFVAFALHDLRFRRGGGWTRWLTRPIATHPMLNLRTYVRHRGESGIYFLREWLPNALSRAMGGVCFGLPYRMGELNYEHAALTGCGCVRAWGRRGGRLAYRYAVEPGCRPRAAVSGSRDAFLLERYTAFTHWIGFERHFRVWHEPWLAQPIDVVLEDADLLQSMGDWARNAVFVGGHRCGSLPDVWMSRPLTRRAGREMPRQRLDG